MDTLGTLLPKRQSNLLTEKVRNFSKKQLEKEVDKHPESDLSHKDLQGLKKLAVMRVNKGLSMYTWDKHNFHAGSDDQDPSTCLCF